MSLRPSLQDVVRGLQAEGHLGLDAEARARSALEIHQRNTVATPWFVKALAGFGAWVAAAFLVSFFGCVGMWKEEVMMAVMGLGLCGGATALRRASQSVFLEQLALALCLAGSTMATTGIAATLESENAAAVVQLALGLVLLAVFPDAILRFLTTASVAGAAVFLLWKGLDILGLQLGLLGCAVLVHLLLLNEARLRSGRWGELVGPAAFSLACGVLASLLAFSSANFVRELFGQDLVTPDSLLTLGLTALTLYTAWRVMKELGLEPAGAAGAAVFAALVLLALMTLHTPAVIAAVGMMVLGHHRRSRVLVGLSVAFLLAAGSWYYYDLGLTLLAKALALTGSGLVLLGLRLFLARLGPAAAEVR